MPDVPVQLPNPDEGELTTSPSFVEKTNKRIESINVLIYTVVAAVIISAITALIAVGAVVIDQLHFNNQTYREYSQSREDEKARQEKLNSLQQEVDQLKQTQNKEQPTQ
jgi:membrane protein involved in colicin uptake